MRDDDNLIYDCNFEMLQAMSALGANAWRSLIVNKQLGSEATEVVHSINSLWLDAFQYHRFDPRHYFCGKICLIENTTLYTGDFLCKTLKLPGSGRQMREETAGKKSMVSWYGSWILPEEVILSF